MIINLKGIVVRKYESGDQDLVVHVLSPTHGKLSVLVKHARKSRKSFGSRLDIFERGTFWIRRRGNSLSVLTSFEPEDGFRQLRMNINKLVLASSLAEAVDMLVKEDSQHDALIYEAIALGLRAIDDSESLSQSLKASFLSLSHILAQAGISDMEHHSRPTIGSFVRLIDQLEAFIEKPLRSKHALMEVLDDFRKEASPS